MMQSVAEMLPGPYREKELVSMFFGNSGNKKGFTLIELLVVIAIIAILASILFPVFARARESARKAKCLHNLKEIGTAIINYSNDNGDKFPWAGEDYRYTRNAGDYYDVSVDGVPNIRTYRLTYILQPYSKSEKIFHCPSDTGPIRESSQTYLDTPCGTPLWRYHFGSYGYADVLSFPKDSRLAGYPSGSLIQPTKATMMWEHEIWHYRKSSTEAGDMKYEKDRIMVLFSDGHVKPMGQGEFNAIIWLPRCAH